MVKSEGFFLFDFLEYFDAFVFLSFIKNKKICIHYRKKNRCPMLIPFSPFLWEWNKNKMDQKHGRGLEVGLLGG